MEKQDYGPPPDYTQTTAHPAYPPQPPPPASYIQQPRPIGDAQQPAGYYNQQGQAVVVTQQPGMVVMSAPRPKDYTIPSIIACLCCFWPTGLFAIYYSMRATTLSRDGDVQGAQRMSQNARTLVIVSFVVGVCWIIAVIVLRVVLTYSLAK